MIETDSASASSVCVFCPMFRSCMSETIDMVRLFWDTCRFYTKSFFLDDFAAPIKHFLCCLGRLFDARVLLPHQHRGMAVPASVLKI